MESREIEAIRQLTTEWTAATAFQDIPKLLSLLTDDVIFLPRGAPPIRGKRAVEAMYTMFFGQFSKVHQTAVIDEIQISGDWAFSWGTDTMTLVPAAGGDAIVLTGHGLSVLRRDRDGVWKFARGINNMMPVK